MTPDDCIKGCSAQEVNNNAFMGLTQTEEGDIVCLCALQPAVAITGTGVITTREALSCARICTVVELTNILLFVL